MFYYHGVPNISGVYIIKCKINSKLYIGSTEVLDTKISEYKEKLENKKFRINAINEDIKNYGKDNFEIDYLCTCDHEISTIIERYYIKKYKAIEYGYNSINASNKVRKRHKHKFSPVSPNAKLDEATNKVLNWLILDMINLDDFSITELLTLNEIDEEIKKRYKVEVELDLLLGIIYKLDLICYIKDCQYDNLYYVICGTQLIDLIYNNRFFIKNELGKKLVRMFRITIDLDDILIEVPLVKNRTNEINKTTSFRGKNIIVDLKNNKWFNY